MIKRIYSHFGWMITPVVVAGIVILSLLYLILWMELIGNFKLRTTTDFVAFYSAGWIARTEGKGNVYNLDYQRMVEERVSGNSMELDEVNPFVHPPFIVPILSHIVQSDYVLSYKNWALLMTILLTISALFLIFSLPHSSKMEYILLLLSSLLFFPGMVSILNGQDTAILLLGGSIWFYGMVKGKSRLAGLGLALTTIRPQISLILAFPFFFKYRRIWWWYCAGVAFLIVVSLLVLGTENILGFLRILTVSAGGEGYLINERAMVNLLGLLRNIFPNALPGGLRYLSWFSYLAAIVSVCLLWKRLNLSFENYISFAIVISIFFSPHLHYHDLELLLLPLFGIIRLIYLRAIDIGIPMALSMILLSLLLLINHMTPLAHIVPYLLMIFLPVFGIYLMMDSNKGQMTSS